MALQRVTFALLVLSVGGVRAWAEPLPENSASIIPAWNSVKQGAFVTAICDDLQGRIWVGTEGNGLWCFDQTLPEAGRWANFTRQSTGGLKESKGATLTTGTPGEKAMGDDFVYALACDKAGRVWVGHLNHGVSVFNESDEPSPSGFMWSVDTPGANGVALAAMRVNFNEFVRVRFDPVDPKGTDANGSRCSQWSSWHTISTAGEVNSPNEIGIGTIPFKNEVLSTTAKVNTTIPGTLHHAYLKGLRVTTSAGTANESVEARLVDNDGGGSVDVLHIVNGDVTGGQLVGKTADSKIGDQLAYTLTSDFASRMNGDIVGPGGDSGESTAELAHQFAAGAVLTPEFSVTGTKPPQNPVPNVLGVALGGVWDVEIKDAFTEDTAAPGTTQVVEYGIVESDPTSDDVLEKVTATVIPQMNDEATGTLVPSFVRAAFKVLGTATGHIAAKANGDVIGPLGTGGEQNADIAYEVDTSSDNSSSLRVVGPAYSMVAPAVAPNPIPALGTAVFNVDVYVEATGASGNESFGLRVIDADFLGDDVLDVLGLTLPRPANCFPNALIGPINANTTLKNDPPKIVSGRLGSSGEATAQIGYEIGSSSSNSATVDVTAN